MRLDAYAFPQRNIFLNFNKRSYAALITYPTSIQIGVSVDNDAAPKFHVIRYRAIVTCFYFVWHGSIGNYLWCPVMFNGILCGYDTAGNIEREPPVRWMVLIAEYRPDK